QLKADTEAGRHLGGQGGGELDGQRLVILLPAQRRAAAQQRHHLHRSRFESGLASQRRDAHAAFRRAERDRIQRAGLGGEADVPRRVGGVFLEVAGGGLGRALAVDLPRPGAVDGVAVHRHPFAHLAQELQRLGRQAAIRILHHVQQQVAILADDVGQHVHHFGRVLVLVALAVEPVADR
ncbi:conserved hypothetical protein, partial [Ricinus communis]